MDPQLTFSCYDSFRFEKDLHCKSKQEQLQEVSNAVLVFVKDQLQKCVESAENTKLSSQGIQSSEMNQKGKSVGPIISLFLAHSVKIMPVKSWEVFNSILKDIAVTGSTQYPWPLIRLIVACKMEYIFGTQLVFDESPNDIMARKPRLNPIQRPEDFESLRAAMVHFWNLGAAPFSMQRCAEVLLNYHLYGNARKLAFALTKICGSATMPLHIHKEYVAMENLFNDSDLLILSSTLDAVAPRPVKPELSKAPPEKLTGRLSLCSVPLSATPVPKRRRLMNKDTTEERSEYVCPNEGVKQSSPIELGAVIEGSSSSALWRESLRTTDGDMADDGDDDDEYVRDEEDAEEQLDKSNSEYVLSLPENPLSSSRRGAHKQLCHKREQLMKQKQNREEGIAGVIDLLRDLEDDDDTASSVTDKTSQLLPTSHSEETGTGNSLQSNFFLDSPGEPLTQTTNTVSSTINTGLGLLTGYFDDDDDDDDSRASKSTTHKEAMKLLTNSLGKGL